MDREEGEKFMVACFYKMWDNARAMIAKNPWIVCTARDKNGFNAAYWAAHTNDKETLQLIADGILLLSLQTRQAVSKREKEEKEEEAIEQQQQQQQMLRDVFERGPGARWTPAHQAAWHGHVNILVFLVEHAFSGAAVLEVKNKDGSTPAHNSCVHGFVDALDFILRNAPNGMQDGCMFHSKRFENVNRMRSAMLPALSSSTTQEYSGPESCL